MKTANKIAIGVIVIGAALVGVGAYYGTCAKLRFVKEDLRAILADSAKSVRDATANAPDEVLPLLEKMCTEKVWRARFAKDHPRDGIPAWLPRIAKERKVPLNYVAGLIEDTFIKFAGNGHPASDAQERIRKLIGLANRIEPELSPEDAKSLRERLLDAHFVVNDFDGAVGILEKGLAGHSENWCRAAIAKIRAHQAEEKKDDAEALRQFAAFGEAMSAEPDKGIPEYDPSTGVAYCRAWVLAKNARRCSEYAKKVGKDEDSANFRAKAKELYNKALADTADDEKSLAVLKSEIQEAGL